MRCVAAVCKPDADEIELNISLQQYLDVLNTRRKRHVAPREWWSPLVVHCRFAFSARWRRALSSPAGAPWFRINAASHYAALLVAEHSWRRVCVCLSVRGLWSRSLFELNPPHVVRAAPRRQSIRRPVHRHRRRACFCSLGAFPKSILSIIDGLTGLSEAVPIEDQRAVTFAHSLYAEWISRYGVPEQIHSDRGTQFE